MSSELLTCLLSTVNAIQVFDMSYKPFLSLLRLGNSFVRLYQSCEQTGKVYATTLKIIPISLDIFK